MIGPVYGHLKDTVQRKQADIYINDDVVSEDSD